MADFHVSSGSRQVADFLRNELARGRWTGTMPGRSRLAAEIGVSGKLIDAALMILEDEGLLISGGPRRRRRIRPKYESASTRALRVTIATSEAADRNLPYMVDLLHQLQESGHAATFAPKTLLELGRDPARVSRMVDRTESDAWVIMSGSKGVLEWFASEGIPAIALYGRRRSLPIAGVGPEKQPAVVEAVRRTFQLGHRRIVMLSRRERRLPAPGAIERAFLEEVAAHGIEPSAYHLPDWDETPDGFHRGLARLFQITPPTALIVDEAPMFFAATQFLSSQGLKVPDDVSVICMDPDPNFLWFKPTVSHIYWDSRPVIRRIVRWAANVSNGREDLRQTLTKAEFVEGGTLAPAASHR
ncbi:GntR family transcriptional regulator [Haloferula helveola]|uniref:GntR family transcriptional regulator n=1 Tax=Haloferula helveola TaxID=490095 RepID=A0ABM7RAC9_9BACT|nr:GntR family transcriptional regulator [Haloferula helveola]